MKLKRRILSVLLTLAVMVTFMPFVSQQAFAASSSKVQVVTKTTDDDGVTTTYSYNKKGLVSKEVIKYSSKEKSEDEATTVTTTYKYNKKNRIAQKATTNVRKTTSYKTDKTTGARGASEGTVTETNKSVTKYTYNKKGLATQAVTTNTYTKSGSSASVDTWLRGDFRKMADGRFYGAPYVMDEDGDETMGEYRFYTEAEVAAFAKSETYTRTYTDNGNGTYTSTSAYSTDTTPATPYTYKSQNVTTSSFKYDKKKRVKSQTLTRVYTSENSHTTTAGDAYSNSYVTSYAPYTITYAYDKKGHVKKQVNNDSGVIASEDTVSVYTKADGTMNTVRTEHRAAGVGTRTYTENGVDMTSTYPETWRTFTYEVPKAYPSKYSVTYKYDKNGNLKSRKGTNSNTSDHVVYDPVYGEAVYMLNADGTPSWEEVTTPVSTTTTSSAKFVNALKNGTKKILERLGIYKSSTDGYANGDKGSYSLGQTKFKLKAKKVSAKLLKDVELQQWSIQNGVFGGNPGL